MRIAIVHPFAWPQVRRGAERYIDDLVWYLRGKGHLVDLITGASSIQIGTSSREHLQLRHLNIPGLKGLGLSNVETFGLRSFPALLRLRNRYDLVHAMTPSAAIAARTAGHTTVFTVLGHPTPGVPRRWARRRLMERAIQSADSVTTLSPASASAVFAKFGRKAEVLAPGIRTEAFDFAGGSRRGPPRVLFSATLDRPEKGLTVLLAAFEELLSRYPDATLDLSGQGDPTAALRTVRDEATRRRVRILGAGEPAEVPDRYRASHVTVLPSQNEAFGLVLLESLACGTPVVGTDSGGMPSIVDDERIGRIAKVNDAEALLEAITQCLELWKSADTPQRCRRHSMRWDWTATIGPNHEQFYENVAIMNRGSGCGR